jgi:N-acetylglucosamine kinase-like BadF-type ATPase
MAYFAGIDGGGSKTAAAVGDDLKVLGRATAGASKIARVGEAEAAHAIEIALEEACRQSNIDRNQLQRICIGLAGAARSEVVQAVSRIMREIVRSPVDVVGDMVIALQAAFGDGEGAIVIAGTGSICFGRDQRGTTARAGGWGSIISDEGSGEWIGRRAVALALRAHDAGRHTALLPALFTAWKAGTRDQISTIANANPPPDFSQLFPHVLEAEQAGDSLAIQILTEAGTELAALAEIVIRKLWPGGRAANLRLTGGVFQNSQRVRETFASALKTDFPQIKIEHEEVEPVLGALALARRAAMEAAEAS